MRRAAAALGLALALATAAPAAADHTLTLDADTRERGYVGLRLHAAPGSRGHDPRRRRPAPSAPSPRAPPTARLRRFATLGLQPAHAPLQRRPGHPHGHRPRYAPPPAPGGSSCSPRAASAPAQRVAATLRDRWRLGGQLARFCVRGPGTRQRCRRTRLPAGRKSRQLRFRDPRPGLYRLSVRTPQPAAAPHGARQPARRPPEHPRHRRLDDPDHRLLPRAASRRPAHARAQRRPHLHRHLEVLAARLAGPRPPPGRPPARRGGDVHRRQRRLPDGRPALLRPGLDRRVRPPRPAHDAHLCARRPGPGALAAPARPARRLLPRGVPRRERRAAQSRARARGRRAARGPARGIHSRRAVPRLNSDRRPQRSRAPERRRPPQHHRGLTHRRPDHRAGCAPTGCSSRAGAPRRRRPDRRRARGPQPRPACRAAPTRRRSAAGWRSRVPRPG